MRYRAVINFDIEGSGAGAAAGQRQQFYAALRHLGWEKAHTTALVIETENLNAVWQGMVRFIEVQAAMGTSLSAVTFNVQRTDEPGATTLDGPRLRAPALPAERIKIFVAIVAGFAVAGLLLILVTVLLGSSDGAKTSAAARTAASAVATAPTPPPSADLSTPPRATLAGCSKDTDCKGERTCEEGRCVTPKK